MERTASAKFSLDVGNMKLRVSKYAYCIILYVSVKCVFSIHYAQQKHTLNDNNKENILKRTSQLGLMRS